MNTVKPTDYIEWAVDSLCLDVREIKKLASMSIEQALNPFEIEQAV